jgi:hypothetical protein
VTEEAGASYVASFVYLDVVLLQDVLCDLGILGIVHLDYPLPTHLCRLPKSHERSYLDHQLQPIARRRAKGEAHIEQWVGNQLALQLSHARLAAHMVEVEAEQTRMADEARGVSHGEYAREGDKRQLSAFVAR